MNFGKAFAAALLSFLLLASGFAYAQNESSLVDAARAGDIQKIKTVLSGGEYSDQGDAVGRTALMEASSSGFIDIVKLLLEHGANPNAQDVQGSTSLELAASGGHANIVEVLLAHGANVNIKARENDDVWETPLIDAAAFDHPDLVELFLAHGADIDAKTWDGQTALSRAAANGYADIVKMLIDHNANTSGAASHEDAFLYAAAKQKEETALGQAVEYAGTNVVKLLLEHGADANSYNSYGSTPLMDAASYGYTDVAKLLLAHGALVNARDKAGRTPLAFALHYGQPDVAALLKENGGTVDRVPVDFLKTREHWLHGRCVLELSVLYPEIEQLKNPDAQAQVNKMLEHDLFLHIPRDYGYDQVTSTVSQRNLKELKECIVSSLRPAFKIPILAVSIRHQSVLDEKNLVSIDFMGIHQGMDQRGRPLGAHPSKDPFAFTYYRRQGRWQRLKLKDLFKPGAPYVARICKLVPAASSLFDEDPSPMEDDFYITQNSLVLLNPCGAYYCESIQYPIPFSKLKNIIDPNGPLSSLQRP